MNESKDGPKRTADWLREFGLRPKKSFGQNFLHDARLCQKIAALAVPDLATPSAVLEIGAGAGDLTIALLARAKQVIAIERDRDLLPLLRRRFKTQLEPIGQHAPPLRFLEADAMRVSWLDELGDDTLERVVVGNLPYQITGRLLERCVAASRSIARAVVMIQAEVATRLLAKPGGGDYGVLSVFTQAAFQVERAFRVGPGAFLPPPRVSSTVVTLTPWPQPRATEDAAFRLVVKSAFAQRRKTLRNNWKVLPGWSPADLAQEAAAAGIDLGARAETLAVEDFARLAANLTVPAAD